MIFSSLTPLDFRFWGTYSRLFCDQVVMTGLYGLYSNSLFGISYGIAPSLGTSFLWPLHFMSSFDASLSLMFITPTTEHTDWMNV